MKGYLRLYRAEAGLPPRTHRKKTGNVTWPPIKEPKDSSLKEHESMSKEDLIDTLVIARINEARPVLFEEYYLRYLSHGSSGSTPRAVWIQALNCFPTSMILFCSSNGVLQWFPLMQAFLYGQPLQSLLRYIVFSLSYPVLLFRFFVPQAHSFFPFWHMYSHPPCLFLHPHECHIMVCFRITLPLFADMQLLGILLQLL